MNIAVIGSRNYRLKGRMEIILMHYVLMQYPPDGNVCIISGKCPVLESVDNWAINWAKRYGYKTHEYVPEENTKEAYFARNKKIAEAADMILGFVYRDQLRSGTWNTIKYFREFGKYNYRVFDQRGESWDRW